MSKTAIQVTDVTKIYKLYDRPKDRLKESLGLTRKKCYQEHYALNHINFEVEKGETVGIIGTNGSGKSTMLKLITGVLTPTEGKIEVDGRISALLELGAGFNMEYTGIENVYLNGSMIGFSKSEIDAKLQDILDFADIGEFVHQPVKSYSSGMFVRLAFAVAINIDPEILIVDEALSVGDVFFQAKCYRKFEEFKKQGRTILFVSHDLGSITKYCDRAILLNRGEKIFEGTPKETVDIYKKVLVGQFDPSELEQDMDANDITKLSTDKEWKEKIQVNPELIEYGEKSAEITDYALLDDNGLITNTFMKGSTFSVRMKITFHEEIKEPIFAFTIKNLQGIELTGTNTMYEKVDVPPMKAGETKEVTFTQRLDLQGGEYLISLGCTGYRDGDFQVYHRLYDVCSLTVISDKNTVGYFDMNSAVTLGESRHQE
ncbi:MAG: ABC transporter ATP-binding protein [Lachnospiraceae bacterium]|jgi:teichoic acid transport system ATP-binding protein|nr:ABC transporter ATP-binding protein [Lachnospiraceae bacterium]